jgi:hypothetical protein
LAAPVRDAGRSCYYLRKAKHLIRTSVSLYDTKGNGTSYLGNKPGLITRALDTSFATIDIVDPILIQVTQMGLHLAAIA